ncbi:PRC-barrel domain-containing protein [Pseudonocardia nantongensis]|uniref:PRC-barrel domain-containing protein n=1 Tax=Pseudonocardia nantongensis TaxID=1181885 RepID=UPI00397923B4
MVNFPAENLRDWLGKHVIDPDDNNIGDLEAVYFDTATDEPTFATVKIGIIGRHKLAFVPLDGARVKPDGVRVLYPKKQVKDAPTIATDGELLATDEPAIFAYYGIEASTTSGRMLARR